MAFVITNDQLRKNALSDYFPFYRSYAPNLSNNTCQMTNYPIIAYPWALAPDQAYNLCHTVEPLSGYDAWHDYWNMDCYVNDPSQVFGFTARPLLMNVEQEPYHFDALLFDPWNSMVLDGTIWIVNAGSSIVSNYNLQGVPLMHGFHVLTNKYENAEPTDMICNLNTSAFPIYDMSTVYIPSLIICTRFGTINAYNADLNPWSSVCVIDKCENECVFTSMECVEAHIIVIDFYHRTFCLWDTQWQELILKPLPYEPAPEDYYWRFMDETLPEDYAPYNITCISDILYVTYAKQNPVDHQYPLFGHGFGYVNCFTLHGVFIRRFISESVLNAPYGLIVAPTVFGYAPGTIIIANHGDGYLNIFDMHGKHCGNLRDANGVDVVLDGIRGLTSDDISTVIWVSSFDRLRGAAMGILQLNTC